MSFAPTKGRTGKLTKLGGKVLSYDGQMPENLSCGNDCVIIFPGGKSQYMTSTVQRIMQTSENQFFFQTKNGSRYRLDLNPIG